MEPIVRAKARQPVPPAVHAAVGLIVLLLSAAVMVPWLTLFAAYVSAAFLGRGIWAAGRAVAQMVDYAGSVALGR